MGDNDPRIDRVAAVQARTPMLPMILEQAEVMLSDLGNSAKRIVILGNATPGRGFVPAEGFALEIATDAPFIPGHFNTQRMFLGTVVMPFVPPSLKGVRCKRKTMEKMWRCLKPCDAMAMFEASSAEALQDLNECSDYMSLAPSVMGAPNTACLMHDSNSGMHFLVVTTHMLPHEDAIEGDISTYLSRRASEDKLTVAQALLPGHPVGNTMARWYKSQRVFRELLGRKLHYRLIRYFFPKADAHHLYTCDLSSMCRGENIAHMVTNVADRHNTNGTIVYYSNATSATLGHGAFVNAGPFKQSLWVNVPRGSLSGSGGITNASVIAAFGKADKLNAIPFTAPTDVYRTMSVLETISRARHDHGDCRDSEKFANVDYCDRYTHLSAPVAKHHSQKELAPLAMACDDSDCREMGDLVWRHYSIKPAHACCHYHHEHHHKTKSHACDLDSASMKHVSDNVAMIETYSPHELLDYVRGFENESTRRSFETLGVNLEHGQCDHVFLTPLFCLSDTASPGATLLADAIEREKRAECL